MPPEFAEFCLASADCAKQPPGCSPWNAVWPRGKNKLGIPPHPKSPAAPVLSPSIPSVLSIIPSVPSIILSVLSVPSCPWFSGKAPGLSAVFRTTAPLRHPRESGGPKKLDWRIPLLLLDSHARGDDLRRAGAWWRRENMCATPGFQTVLSRGAATGCQSRCESPRGAVLWIPILL